MFQTGHCSMDVDPAADVSRVDHELRTPLHIIAKQDLYRVDVQTQIAELLILNAESRDAYIGKQDYEGNTAIHYAANIPCGHLMKLFIDHLKDRVTILSQPNNSGDTALGNIIRAFGSRLVQSSSFSHFPLLGPVMRTMVEKDLAPNELLRDSQSIWDRAFAQETWSLIAAFLAQERKYGSEWPWTHVKELGDSGGPNMYLLDSNDVSIRDLAVS